MGSARNDPVAIIACQQQTIMATGLVYGLLRNLDEEECECWEVRVSSIDTWGYYSTVRMASIRASGASNGTK